LISQAVRTATATADPPDNRSMAASCEAPAKTMTEKPTAPSTP
jgi:hypothetical protein